MAEEERVCHTATCLGHQTQDGQDEQRAEVRRRSEEEVVKEHGSSRQQMVAVVTPVAYKARGAHSRC